MATAELTEKLISDHNNPITKKVKLFESKLFLGSLEDKERLETCLGDIEKNLRHNRVDRRVARAAAEWLPDKNIAKLTKKTGAVASFGVENKNGKILTAEETLFLLEMNKLELTLKEMPVSIEEAFRNISRLEKYLAYKQLALHGFKLKCSNGKQPEEGCKFQNDDGPPTKVAKMTNLGQTAHIFEKLRQNGPKSFQPNGSYKEPPDYNVQNTAGKGDTFNLIINTSQEFATSVDEGNLNTHAIVADDNVAFYKFYNTRIPIL